MISLPHSKNKDFLGISLAVFYNLFTCLSCIVVSEFEQNFSPIILIFYNFLFAFILFTLIAAPRFRQTFTLLRKNKKAVLQANIVTLLAWLPAFFCVKYIMPIVVIMIIFGLIPLLTLILPADRRGWQPTTKQDMFFAGLTAALVVVVIIYNTLAIQDLSSMVKIKEYIVAMLFILIGAIGNAAILTTSKNLNVLGFSTTQIMSVRFYALVIGASIAMSLSHLSLAVTHAELLRIGMIFIISVALPITFAQLSINLTSPLYISFVDTLQPILAFCIQSLYWQKVLPTSLFILAAAITLSAVAYSYFKTRSLKLTRGTHANPDLCLQSSKNPA